MSRTPRRRRTDLHRVAGYAENGVSRLHIRAHLERRQVSTALRTTSVADGDQTFAVGSQNLFIHHTDALRLVRATIRWGFGSTVSPSSLAHKVIVIIGGTTGLGLSAAKAFVAAGAQTVVVGRKGDSLEAALEILGPEARGLAADASD